MRKKALSSFAYPFLALMVFLTGCNEKSTVTDEGPVDIETVIEQTVQNMRSVDTYRFDSYMNMHVVQSDEEETNDLNAVYTFSGEVDNPLQQLHYDLKFTGNISGIGRFTYTEDVYIVDFTAYDQVTFLGVSSDWSKEPFQDLYWNEISSLEPHIHALEHGVTEYTGTETINGKQCYTVQAVPKSTEAAEIARQMFLSLMMDDEYTISFITESLAENVSMTYWIDKETHWINRHELRMSGEYDSSTETEADYDEGTMTLTIMSDWYDFNDRFSITIPEETHMAVEVDDTEDEDLSNVTFSFREAEIPPESPDFTWEVSQPQENWLAAIWGFSDDDIFTVGGNGTVLHYDGLSWNKVPFPENIRLRGIWGTDADNLYVCGEDGMVFHYDGDSWQDMDCISKRSVDEIWGTSDDDIYVTSAWEGEVFHYDGKSWELSANVSEFHDEEERYPAPLCLPGIWGTSSHDIYIVGGCSTILHWDGNAWDAIAHSNTWSDFVEINYGVWGSASDDVYVSTNNNREPPWAIIHFDGTSWSKVVETSNDIRSIWGTSADNVFAVGRAHFYASILHFNGESWTAMGPAEPLKNVYLNDIWGSSEDNIFIVGDEGYILHYSND